MITFYKILNKIMQILLNILFFIQIALMITIFLTAAYWFFNLMGSSAFSFAEPLADGVSNLVKMFYNRDIQAGGIYIDGSILLFDILAIVFVLLITKFKYYIHCIMNKIDSLITIQKKAIEDKFNKKLKDDAENLIRKYTNVAVIVQFEAKDTRVDAAWGGNPKEGVKEREEEAFKTFYSSLKTLSYCKFAKSGNGLLIQLSDFEKVDNLIYFIEQAIKRIKINMKKDRWNLNSYIAIDVYSDDADFKTEIYPNMQSLLKLKFKDEFLCFGNFNLRYNLKTDRMYDIKLLKGSYKIDGSTDIYSLVKKN